jgi:uncharacterized membrane protein
MTGMDASGASMVRPTALTSRAVQAMIVIIGLSAIFLVSNYESLPSLLPVHFRSNGFPNGWQYKTFARVLMPVFVQLALATILGAVAALLLSRPHGRQDDTAPDVRAAAAAAEAVMSIALIWVAFQAYASMALVNMWTVQRAGLGRAYFFFEILGVLLTLGVAVRAHLRLGRPEPRPYVAEHWRFGHLYKNAADPALFVPTRDGSRWTLNFGRPRAAALLGLILGVGIIGPAIILVLALR